MVVSIPVRVLDVLKRSKADWYFTLKNVSIPVRVLDVLKLQRMRVVLPNAIAVSIPVRVLDVLKRLVIFALA